VVTQGLVGLVYTSDSAFWKKGVIHAWISNSGHDGVTRLQIGGQESLDIETDRGEMSCRGLLIQAV
jgi:hypothetical protein